MNHSPAPWHLRPDPHDSEGWIVSDGSHSAIRVCDVSPRFDPNEELHNARLIAAAPEMHGRVEQAREIMIDAIADMDANAEISDETSDRMMAFIKLTQGTSPAICGCDGMPHIHSQSDGEVK
jgi:hypothetical protein